MTTPTQRQGEKSWLDKLEEFLVDEFHYGLERLITETLWGSDVRVGAWTDALQFFECLNFQHEYIVANQSRPAHIRSHLQLLNFSGKDISGGEEKRWLADQLPKNRQNILLLHSVRLILENRDREKINLSLIVPIIRREIHQCLRLVFFHLSNGPHAKGLKGLTEDITQYEWLPMNDVRQRLGNNLILWLEQQGVRRGDIDDLSKLGKFSRTLTRFMHYHSKIDEPIDFEYGPLFSDWQKYGFVSTMIYEIDRLGSLVYLEGLSHERRFSVDTEIINPLQLSAEKRKKGGTRYQTLLALHYLLKFINANGNNTKKAKFISFLTGFSEHTLRQELSNIHRKSDVKGPGWETDMRIVDGYFEDLGLSEVRKLIQSDLKSQDE